MGIGCFCQTSDGQHEPDCHRYVKPGGRDAANYWHDKWTDQVAITAQRVKELAEARAELNRIKGHMPGTIPDWVHAHDNMQVERDEARAEVARLKEVVDYWKDHWETEAGKNNAIGAELSALRAKVDTLFPAIQHGDGNHRAWLAAAIKAHFAEGGG